MKTRRLHRVIGLVMLLPLWTGVATVDKVLGALGILLLLALSALGARLFFGKG